MKIYGVIDYEKRDSYEEGRQDGYNTGKQEGYDTGRQDGETDGLIRGSISTCKSLGVDRTGTKSELMKTHELSEEAAEEYLKKYW